MAEYFYLVMKDKKRKRALIVYLGSSLDVIEKDDIKKVTEMIKGFDDYIEANSDIMEVRLLNFTLRDFNVLVNAFDKLMKLKYDYSFATYGSIYATLKIWGLIEALSEEDTDFEIFSDYSDRYSTLVEDLQKEGYEVWWWGVEDDE